MDNLVLQEDVNYLIQESKENIEKVTVEMISLMNDSNKKLQTIESQNWFKRMVKTVTGKNTLSKNEIKANSEKLNFYMIDVISELYKRQVVEQRVILSLSRNINNLIKEQNNIYKELYNTKYIMGSFVKKLNEKLINLTQKLNNKVDSIDNFYMLIDEIRLGTFTHINFLVAICMILSKVDENNIKELDNKKIRLLEENMKKMDIINDDKIDIIDFFKDIKNITPNNLSKIYIEISSFRNNYIVDMLLQIIENLLFNGELRKEELDFIMLENRINTNIQISLKDIFNKLLKCKIEILEELNLGLEKKLIESEIEENKTIIISKEEAKLEYGLGKLYLKEENFSEGIKHLIIAAEQGNENAQYELGKYYIDARKEERDRVGVKWLERAAKQGRIEAKFELGKCYKFGYGVTKDSIRGYKYIKKAALLGNKEAENFLMSDL